MLTHEDLDLLSESLDSHLSRQVEGNVLGSMFGAMLLCKDEESRDKWEKEQERSNREREIKSRRMKDTVTLLKAKLITIRQELDSLDAEKVLEDARK